MSNNIRPETFTTTEGARQGGALNTILFVIFVDKIIKK